MENSSYRYYLLPTKLSLSFFSHLRYCIKQRPLELSKNRVWPWFWLSVCPSLWPIKCKWIFTGVPSPWDLMPDDLRWSWCNNNRNKVHNKCKVLESSWNISPIPNCGKIVFQETSSWCKKVWGLLHQRLLGRFIFPDESFLTAKYWHGLLWTNRLTE